MTARQTSQYVMCAQNDGNEIDLIVGKLYRAVEPDPNDSENEIRVIDESGEDYLYPRNWFIAVDLPQAAIDALEAA